MVEERPGLCLIMSGFLKRNVIGEVDGAAPIFYQMMVPERFGTAAMTIGAVRPALEIATDYSTKRKAFGRTINKFRQ